MGPIRAGLILATLISVTACTVSQTSPQIEPNPATHDLNVVDLAYPPELRELSFVSSGSKLNGLMYVANGPGPHPTVILLHGYAGNERNLDLAQAMRRDGKNVLYFNYRGTWGSGGEFSIANALEDVAKALELLRDKRWASTYRSDTNKVALVGHSFGGFLGAVTTANNKDVSCFAFLAGANIGVMGAAAKNNGEVRAQLEEIFGSDMDPQGGPIHGNASRMVGEMISGSTSYDIRSYTPSLSSRPLLLVAGERDKAIPKSEHHDQVLAALRKSNAERLTEIVFNDDHSFSANRIQLAKNLIEWQREECWRLPRSTSLTAPK